jgi:hypothetical protein
MDELAAFRKSKHPLNFENIYGKKQLKVAGEGGETKWKPGSIKLRPNS